MPEAFTQLKCTRCGGELQREGESTFVCLYCGKRYINQSVKKIEDALRGIIDDERHLSVANLRRLLYNEVKKEFVSNIEVERLCKEILNYIPDDFYANFYLATCSTQKDALDVFLNSVDVKSRMDDVPDMLDYLLKALKPDWSMAVGCFIEKAYKDTDISLYNKYRTMYERIYAAIEEGVFEPSLPRDVFVAYSSMDMAKVTSVVNALESENLSCFVAARNLCHGSGSVENYRKAIDTAIENCTVVVFVSSRSSRSIRCDAYTELNYIRELDKRTGKAKPRVEFLIENYMGAAMERFFTDFFKNLEYCVSEKAVVERVLEKIIEISSENFAPPPIVNSDAAASMDLKLKQQAEEERKRQQAVEAQKRAEEERKRQQAVEAQRRAEEERKRQQEENRKRAEAERQRKLAEERKRQEESDIKKRLRQEKKLQKKQSREGSKNKLTPAQRKKRNTIIITSIVSVAVAATVTASLVCAYAPLNTVKVNGITYRKESGSYSVYLYSGDESTVTIPEKVRGVEVTKISNGAFLLCSKLTNVTIPDTVTEIGYRAFRKCTSLTSITIPYSIDYIAKEAFSECTSLESVTFTATTGWCINSFSACDESDDISISVSDSEVAAEYLTFTYCNFYWHR